MILPCSLTDIFIQWSLDEHSLCNTVMNSISSELAQDLLTGGKLYAEYRIDFNACCASTGVDAGNDDTQL